MPELAPRRDAAAKSSPRRRRCRRARSQRRDCREDTVDRAAPQRGQALDDGPAIGGREGNDDLVYRTELRVGLAAERRVERVANDQRPGEDRRAQERPEEHEHCLTFAPARVTKRQTSG
jgi:hypothetical protein